MSPRSVETRLLELVRKEAKYLGIENNIGVLET